MIRFRVGPSEQHPSGTVFLGLSDADLTHLEADYKIRVKANDAIDLGVEVVIFHGDTEVEMARELEDGGYLPEGSTALAEAQMEHHGEFRLENEKEDE